MPQTVMKLYAATSGDAVASIDVPDGGIIEGVQWAADSTAAGDAETLRAELSFASTSGFTSNDTRASITGIRNAMNFTTSGADSVGINMFVPMEVEVQAGERLYLHTSNNATGTISCWIYLRLPGGGARPPRARFRA